MDPKPVGVAVCDPLGMTAQGVETITRKEENKLRKTLARIEALVEEYRLKPSFWDILRIWMIQLGNVR